MQEGRSARVARAQEVEDALAGVSVKAAAFGVRGLFKKPGKSKLWRRRSRPRTDTGALCRRRCGHSRRREVQRPLAQLVTERRPPNLRLQQRYAKRPARCN
eukprot:4730147-Pleurochrysis_carterae.AAC.1